jgi:hypothetical protein
MAERDRIAALASDPDARVMVLIDGQNLYKTCRRLFGRPHCHPHLLAEHLAGARTRNRVACRFYTGVPDRNVPGETLRAGNMDRRLSAMRTAGVTVIPRKLRYHWDWGHQEPLPAPGPNSPPRQVTLRPWQRPQEKGNRRRSRPGRGRVRPLRRVRRGDHRQSRSRPA